MDLKRLQRRRTAEPDLLLTADDKLTTFCSDSWLFSVAGSGRSQLHAAKNKSAAQAEVALQAQGERGRGSNLTPGAMTTGCSGAMDSLDEDNKKTKSYFIKPRRRRPAG